MDKERQLADFVEYDDAVAAALALSLSRNSLLEDASTQISMDRSVFHFLDHRTQRGIVDVLLIGDRVNFCI